MDFTPEDARRLDRVGWKQQEHDRKLGTVEKGLDNVTRNQQKDHERLEMYIAVSESAAKAAKDAADRSLTAKQLYITLGAFLVALAALIIGLH